MADSNSDSNSSDINSSNKKSCWECLKKRRVCDSAQPACRKCRARGIDCPGYDHKPLKWLQPGQTRSKGQRAREESTMGSVVVCDLALYDSPKISCEAKALLDALEYYNINVCPDMVATGNGVQSDFFIPLNAVSYIPPTVAESFKCVALGHRILQFRKGYHDEAERKTLAKRLQKHRGAAIRSLSEDLARPGYQTSNEALASVLTFLLSEIQQSISPNWRQHCDAAYTILEMRDKSFPHALLGTPFRHLFQYLILADVMGATTSPDITPSRANRQSELISLLPALYGNGISTSLPCPPTLLAAIILINKLRSRQRTVDADDGEDIRAGALVILGQIKAFSVENWAANVSEYHLSNRVQRSTVMGEVSLPHREASLWNWKSLARIYQAAVSLYCISSLLDPTDTAATSSHPTGMVTKTITLRKTYYYNVVMHNLKEIALSQTHQLRKLVLWPLVIAGLHTDLGNKDDRRFIAGELEWISRILGIATPLVANDFLEKLWQNGERSGRCCDGSRWDNLFDRPYVFAV